VSLLGGSAAVLLFSPPAANVAGASGAVFGLMGALAILLRRLRFPLAGLLAELLGKAPNGRSALACKVPEIC
jgi:membrane associated rhomboid family serine protease